MCTWVLVYLKCMCMCSVSRISPWWARAGFKKTLCLLHYPRKIKFIHSFIHSLSLSFFFFFAAARVETVSGYSSEVRSRNRTNFTSHYYDSFSSLQLRVVIMYVAEKAHNIIMLSVRLSEGFPTLPLKQFQCSSVCRWPSLVLSRKIV